MERAPSIPTPVPGTPGDLLFGLGMKSRALFFREMATMVDAGLSMSRALRMAASHTVPRRAEEMARALEDGASLSAVLARYPYYFGEFERAVVAAGEAGGSLDRRLKDLAGTLESLYDLQQQVLSKLWYPLIVLHAVVFVPTLPLMVLQGPGVYLATTLGTLVPAYVLAFVAFAAYRMGSQNGLARMFIDRTLDMVPFLGATLRTLAAARFLDCLGQLYEAGMPVRQCLALAARSSGNSLMAARLAPAVEALDTGIPLTRALAGTRALPSLALQMLESGEEAGRLPELLAKTASYMHQQVEHTSQRVMTVLPVLLMLFVGAVVGFFVIRFYAGMFAQLYQVP